MVRNPITVPSDLTLQEFFDDVFSAHRHTAYPVMEGDAVVGLFAARDLDAVPRDTWPSVRVNARMQPLGQAVVVTEQDELPDAFMRLLETDLRCALVLRDSRLTGLLSQSDVERLFEARRASQPGTQRRVRTRRLTSPEP